MVGGGSEEAVIWEASWEEMLDCWVESRVADEVEDDDGGGVVADEDGVVVDEDGGVVLCDGVVVELLGGTVVVVVGGAVVVVGLAVVVVGGACVVVDVVVVSVTVSLFCLFSARCTSFVATTGSEACTLAIAARSSSKMPS